MSLLDSLVSYWKLDEASGDATDSHGSNHLTDNNGVGTTTGVLNGARNFTSASSQFFEIASNSSLQMGADSYTIQAWVRLSSTALSKAIISKDGGTTGVNREFWMEASSTPALRFWTYRVSDGGQQGAVGSPNLNATNTFCIHAWRDAVVGEVGVAINAGTPVTATATIGAQDTGTAPFRIGARAVAGSENYYPGWIDEVGIWRRVLTSQERTDLYNGGAGLAYESFGGGGGAVIVIPRRSMKIWQRP